NIVFFGKSPVIFGFDFVKTIDIVHIDINKDYIIDNADLLVEFAIAVALLAKFCESIKIAYVKNVTEFRR
ncbi:hypothetical protein PV326_001387, partial [Microctonus aethiopoides]